MIFAKTYNESDSIVPKQIIHASPNIAPDRGDFRIKKR